jgi:hypothetical protein
MKKLPYASCFIVVQINKQIKKFYFNEVIDYKDYSNPDFDDHKQYMCQLAFVDDKSADELFVLMCQAYLNSKAVLKEFKAIAKKSCNQSFDLCVTLVVDIHTKIDGGATIQICTLANDEKRDAFNHLSQFISENNMKFFMQSLTNEQQDLLFDFA